jgi:hypothetical protein
MKISAQFALWSSIAFSIICLYVGFNGLSSVDAVADEAARAAARGFAYFWLLLGAVAVACALVWWWIVRRETANPSD